MAQDTSSFRSRYSAVLADFFRAYLPSTIGYILCSAFCVAGLAMAGIITDEKIWWLGVAVAAFMVGLDVVQLVSIYVIAPKKLQKTVETLPEEIQQTLPKEYSEAKHTENQFYMQSAVLFYGNRQIEILCYKDIKSIKINDRTLLLYTQKSDEPVVIRFPSVGTAAVSAAFIKNQNPKIKQNK